MTIDQSLAWRNALVVVVATLGAAGCQRTSIDSHNTVSLKMLEDRYGVTTAESSRPQRPELVLIESSIEAHGDQDYLCAEFALVNRIGSSVAYTGYRTDSWDKRPPRGRISPHHTATVQNGNSAWLDASLGFCGTGLDELIVPTDCGGVFECLVPLPATSAKVGVRCRWESRDGCPHDEVVWSPVLQDDGEGAFVELLQQEYDDMGAP